MTLNIYEEKTDVLTCVYYFLH